MGQPAHYITKPSHLAAELRRTAKAVAAFRAANPFRDEKGKPLPVPEPFPLNHWHDIAMQKSANYSELRSSTGPVQRRRVKNHNTRPKFGGSVAPAATSKKRAS